MLASSVKQLVTMQICVHITHPFNVPIVAYNAILKTTLTIIKPSAMIDQTRVSLGHVLISLLCEDCLGVYIAQTLTLTTPTNVTHVIGVVAMVITQILALLIHILTVSG
jgi:hypothetical protein